MTQQTAERHVSANSHLNEAQRKEYLALIERLLAMTNPETGKLHTEAELSRIAGYKYSAGIAVAKSRKGRGELGRFLQLKAYYDSIAPGGGTVPLKDVTRAGQPPLKNADEKTPLPPQVRRVAPLPPPQPAKTNGHSTVVAVPSLPYDSENPFSHLDRARQHLVSAANELDTLANNMANLPAFVREKLRGEIQARSDMIREIIKEFTNE